MVRTQIQLTQELYDRLKEVAEQQEWTLAETVRRSLEKFVEMYPKDPISHDEWRLPEPLHLGEFLAPVESWRELANAQEP